MFSELAARSTSGELSSSSTLNFTDVYLFAHIFPFFLIRVAVPVETKPTKTNNIEE
jgi:hypothetical protein